MTDEDDNLALPDAGKRLMLNRSEGMGDWFYGDSPRNGPYATPEGPWFHWVHLAAQILSHPFTELVAPEYYRPELKEFADRNIYTDADAQVPEDEVVKWEEW